LTVTNLNAGRFVKLSRQKLATRDLAAIFEPDYASPCRTQSLYEVLRVIKSIQTEPFSGPTRYKMRVSFFFDHKLTFTPESAAAMHKFLRLAVLLLCTCADGFMIHTSVTALGNNLPKS
jgi:hypothetical protein